MQGTVVGYAVVDYEKKNSPDRVRGVSVHITRAPRKDQEFYGEMTQEIWVSDLLLRNSIGEFQIGGVYDFSYDYDGKYSHLVDIVPVDMPV